jgi:hypothetical protein
VGAAIYHLALDDAKVAERLLRRALTLHATPEVRALWRLVTVSSRRMGHSTAAELGGFRRCLSRMRR